MPKRWDKERQTLDHPSPECLWRGKKLDQALDMWSVAVVVSYMCGNPFCDVSEGQIQRLIKQWVNQLGAPRPDNFTGFPAWEQHSQLFCSPPKEASAWPPGMAVELGKSGQQLVGSLFSYAPHDRPSSSEVLEHPFLAVCSFPLIGVRLESGTCFEGSRPSVIFDNIEGLGRQLPQDGISCKSLYPLVQGLPGQSLFAGERHQWGMRCIEVAREIVQHLLGDDAFLEGTEANRLLVELALGREVIRYTKKENRILLGASSRERKRGSGVTWVRARGRQ